MTEPSDQLFVALLSDTGSFRSTTEFQYFANRRLYQEELPLFDTPTAEYVAPQASEAHNGEVSTKKKRKGSRHSNSGRNGGAGSRNGSGSSGSGGKKGRKGRSRDKAAAQSSGDSVVNQSDLLSQSGSSQPGYWTKMFPTETWLGSIVCFCG